MDGSSVARGGSAAQSPTSPASSRHGNGAHKRKRSTGGPSHLESSPGSGNEDEHGDNDKKRQPGVKRACNECRQQKVSQPTPAFRLPSRSLPPPPPPTAPAPAHQSSTMFANLCHLHIAPLQRRTDSLAAMLSLHSPQARVQDRDQLQARRQALQARRDGKGN